MTFQAWKIPFLNSMTFPDAWEPTVKAKDLTVKSKDLTAKSKDLTAKSQGLTRQGQVCEASGFKPRRQGQGHTLLNPKDCADVLRNYINFSESYDQLTRKAAARAWRSLLLAVMESRTQVSRPMTVNSVLEDPRGQRHVLQDSMSGT